jgi:CheY-like chemotaxis protein
MANRKRILYVEDNVAVRTVRVLMMERDGYEVTSAETAAQAMHAVRDGNIDLAVVDFGLPDARGDELCARLKAAVPGLPVILVSGSVPEHLNDSADIFLIKGEEPGELMKAVARLLGET